MKLPDRDELLAANLPVERVFGDTRARVVFRYPTEHAAATHLQTERDALRRRR